MKIRVAGAVLFRADRRRDRRAEANIHFFLARLKLIIS